MSLEPLSDSLESLDTSFPLLEKERYQVIVKKAELTTTKAGPNSRIKLELVTTAPAKSSKGDHLEAGVRIFEGVMCVKSGNSTDDIIKRQVASVVQCFGIGSELSNYGSNSMQQIANISAWHKLLEGKDGVVDIDIEAAQSATEARDGKPHPAKNVVVMWVKK